MSEFKREERYIVVKLKNIGNAELERKFRHMISHELQVPTVECLVVESDWPIYEEAWDMVQRLAEGREQKIDQLQRQNDELNLIKSRYEALIFAVETKHPDESRHETALRYIQQAENRGNTPTINQ